MKNLPFLFLFFVSALFFTNCKNTANQYSSLPQIDSLFADYYEERLALFPYTATSIGDPRYNDTLVNFHSEEYIIQLKAFYQKYITLVSDYPVDQLNDDQQLFLNLIYTNSSLMLRGLDLDLPFVPTLPYGLPKFVHMSMNQFWDFHLSIGQLATGTNIQPFKTVEDYGNWLLRVDDYIQIMNSTIEKMRVGMGLGIVQPRSITERIIEQLKGMNAPYKEHIFYMPALNMPMEFSPEQISRLHKSYRHMVEEKIIPLHNNIIEFLEKEYLPASRETSGIGSLPGGEEAYNFLIEYHTGTNMNASEIFDLGMKEVSRIRREMEEVMERVSFEGSLEDFFHHVKTNRDLMPFTDPQEVIDNLYSIYERMKPQLEELFELTPKTGFEVRRVEAFRENEASAEYQAGSPDGSRNGIFYVPVPDVESYNIYSEEDLFLHEAIPGHHYQISIQKESEYLPDFQRFFIEYNDFIEGWALYAESLGEELGLYTDPYQYFGMLSWDMHRAIRLVVDAGIHSKGWSREKAIDFFLENEAVSEDVVISEVERYMVVPAQALSYKIGQLRILDLRANAEETLGEDFDIREFHREVLELGSIPILLLEEKINRWIDSKEK
jgi:uncharacterized protein (DUF885 family)